MEDIFGRKIGNVFESGLSDAGRAEEFIGIPEILEERWSSLHQNGKALHPWFGLNEKVYFIRRVISSVRHWESERRVYNVPADTLCWSRLDNSGHLEVNCSQSRRLPAQTLPTPITIPALRILGEKTLFLTAVYRQKTSALTNHLMKATGKC